MTRKRKAHPQQLGMSLPNMSRNPNMPTDLTLRQNRALLALLRATNGISREAIDRISGASNGPEVIRQIRKRFGLCKHLHLVCDRIKVFDRDGLPSNPGRYRLTPEGRAKLAEMGVL